MKAINSNFRHIAYVTCIAILLTASPGLGHTFPGLQTVRTIDSLKAHSGITFHKQINDQVSQSYSTLPLTFEANQGQADKGVKYLARSSAGSFLLSATDTWLILSKSSTSGNSLRDSCKLRMTFAGATDSHRVTASGEQRARSSYFLGNNPKNWHTNVPTYSRITFHNLYPGIDVLYHGNNGQFEYDFVVAPGASSKDIRIVFEGARRIRLDESGDLIVETSIGEIRQHRPIIYQQSGPDKSFINGTYTISGQLEAGFEIPVYDSTRTLIIDPVVVYSTSIGGSSDDNANAVAIDAAGNAYITGTTTSIDFPSVNAFQPSLKPGEFGTASDVFVAKLNSGGTALLYSTYLGGSGFDAGNGIAVDSSGSAYITGGSLSTDFPTTGNAFQRKASDSGDAFVTKLAPDGNSLSYSTYLGGPNSRGFGNNTNAGRGIAVDRDGYAYVAGHTYSEVFPLKRPLQSSFNKGSDFGSDCIHFFFLAPIREDAFITKLNQSGSGLVYSTYLGGSAVDEAYAIAVDPSGSAYVVGTTCSPDFPGTVLGNDLGAGAFLSKLSPSGKKLVYSRRFGGLGNDFAYSVAVDSDGSAYVSGQTDSDDFPTVSPLQPALGGSVLYITTDGGAAWKPVQGFSNSSINAVVFDPSNPLRVLAGLSGRFPSSGLLESTDGGQSWKNPGFGSPFPNNVVQGINIDPNNPSIIYTDLYKSTNRAASWTLMQFPSGGPFGPTHLLIDPSKTSTVYLLSLGGIAGDVVAPPRFFKSTDAGVTWNLVRNGVNLFAPTSAALDLKNPSTLYATNGDLYKSTDGGATWRIPYQGTRSFSRLALDPINPTTLFLSDLTGSAYKTTDGGASFTRLVNLGIHINELQIDPSAPTTIYAATGSLGRGGAVYKTTDGGETWNTTDLVAAQVNSLAIDPSNPAKLIAGVDFDTDGFVVKSNAAGTALAYSTYLGTRSLDVATAIGVDAAGSAYVAGKTLSDRFPGKDAIQASKPNSLFDSSAFVTALDPNGLDIAFLTYVGSNEQSAVTGIAVDPSGRISLVGTTGPGQFAPAEFGPSSVRGGIDALVVKIASPPRISGVSAAGKNLIVSGQGFDSGAVILIDGVEQKTQSDDSRPSTTLIGKKVAKRIASGQEVNVRVRNSDGLLSESFSFVK